ncbi:odorant receptor 46a [Megalopta genalis]|uniref:odorant receptor 46a n=1 Tax=Megalopta genalis TaxID=115081 RepID=UPI003FD3EB7A
MQVLRWTFMLITLCGCWRLPSWNSTPWRYLYNVYTWTCTLLTLLLLVGEILDLVLTVDNRSDLSENLFKTMTFAVDCYKLATILSSRENIETLMDILESEPFAPVSDEELEIRTKFDKSAEKVMKIYMTGLDVWSAWTVLGSLAVNFTSRKLLYRVWLPFEYKSATIFSLVYLHHALITVFSITLAVAYDSLFTGLMIHIYSQFEILGYRLRNVHRMADDSVKHCVRHHDQIYKFANMVNDEFKSVTFIQFFMTTGVMCFSLYQLSLSEHSGNLADVFFYGSCLLLQIFYFCWFGNEVKLKSLEVADMIFESEWTLLNDSTKRILLMMMRRATVPIEFTSNHIVSMNVEAFKTLIKTSYSVFNLLRQN